MAENKNQDTQNTQNSGSATNFDGEQNSNAGFDENNQSFGGQSGGTGTSARQAKDENFSASGASSSENTPIESVKDTAKGVLDQVKETAGQKLEEQKTTLASGLTSVAESLKQVGGTLRESDEENPITGFTAKYGDSLANQIEQVGSYFERKGVREVYGDVENFARRNPAIFIGAAFGLGILAARFLKSGPNRNLTQGAGQTFEAEAQTASNPF